REVWAFPGDWFDLETLELEPLGTGPCTWGWVGTGAAMVVAASQATIRLDSTRFMQTPLTSVIQGVPKNHLYNYMKTKEKTPCANFGQKRSLLLFCLMYVK